jgi:hypothetical protein
MEKLTVTICHSVIRHFVVRHFVGRSWERAHGAVCAAPAQAELATLISVVGEKPVCYAWLAASSAASACRKLCR